MTDQEYKYTQDLLISFSQAISKLNLGEFIDRARTADAVGPILDPTAYQKSAERLQAIENLAQKAKGVQNAYFELALIMGRNLETKV